MSYDREIDNPLFIIRSSLNNLHTAIQSYKTPVLFVAKDIQENLTTEQKAVLQKSFLDRANNLNKHINLVKNSLQTTTRLEDLFGLQSKLQNLHSHYLLSERVLDYYMDVLHTRSEQGMGILLKGLDRLAYESLKQGYEQINEKEEIPLTICHLDAGIGAAILSKGIQLWDYQANPAALIKIVRSSIATPKLTCVCHECGHQLGKITGWNEELARLIYKTVIDSNFSKDLARYWSFCSSEIAADFYCLSQCNFAAVVGLAEVLLAASSRIYHYNAEDPHPISWGRVMLGLTACETVLGNGPWTDYRKAWQTLFPLERARGKSANILAESLPLFEPLCKAIINSHMECFNGKSLREIIPWENTSPKLIKNFLNEEMSDFSVSEELYIKKPIVALTCFRYIQMFGGKPHKWLEDKMRDWLISLGSGWR